MWSKHFADLGNGFCSWGPMVGHGFLGLLLVVLFWSLVAFFFLWLIKLVVPKNTQKTSDDAFEILRSRYASGEISQTEYNKMKAALEIK